MGKQLETNDNLKYEIRGNVYEIVSIANNKVQLQSVNEDYHMEIPYERFYDTIKHRISEIECLLDDESTTDDEFDDLMWESQRQTALLGELECSIRLNDIKEISPDEWMVNFLKSFGTASVTRVISVKQYDIFKRINNGKPFKYNGLRYDIGKGRNNFGTLIISKL